jgi:hypothetical protein
MFQSRTIAIASFCLTIAAAGIALAQACDCSLSTLMGTIVTTQLNNGAPIVPKTVVAPVEIPCAGTTFSVPGPCRWAIDFGAATIRVNFLDTSTYGATSHFTFSTLNPVAPAACQGSGAPYVAGIRVTTNKTSAPYVQNATFTAHSVAVPFAPTSGNVDWNKGDWILVTLKFACQNKATPTPTPTIIVTTAPTPAPTFDPCCPPWNASLFKSSLFYQGTGNISQPYGLKFTPTSTVNSALSAYLNYLHVLFGSTSLTMTFTSTPNVGGPPATWTWPAGVPASSNTYTNMQVGTWYHLCTVISANGQVPRGFISDKCNSCIDVRIQVTPVRGRVLQTKFPNGRVFEQAINASGRAQ